jgi:hypothetical protein
MTNDEALADMREYDLSVLTDITSECECKSFGCEHICTIYAVGDRGDASVGIGSLIISPWMGSPDDAVSWWVSNREEQIALMGLSDA